MNQFVIPTLAGSKKTLELARAMKTGKYLGVDILDLRVYVAPTIKLCKEFAKLVNKYSPDTNVTLIASDDSSDELTTKLVRLRIHDFLTADHVGKTLMIMTHYSYRTLNASDAKGWSVFMDEVPPLYTARKLLFSSSKLVCSADELFNIDSETHVLTVKPSIMRVASLAGLNDGLKHTILELKSGKYKCVALTLPEDQPLSKSNELDILIVPSEGYNVGDQFFLIGAGADKYPIASGATVLKCNEPNANHNSKYINIFYVLENTENSAYFREHYPEIYANCIKTCTDHAAPLHNTTLLSTNVSRSTPFVPVMDGLINIEWNPAGLNAYRDTRQILLAATQNVAKQVAADLKTYFGITQEAIDWDRRYMPNYQRVMRTKIRCEEALTEDDTISIYVLSRSEALKMQYFFPNASLVRIGNVAEPVKRYKPTKLPSEKITTKQAERVRRFINKFKKDKSQFDRLTRARVQIAMEKAGLARYNALKKYKLIP